MSGILAQLGVADEVGTPLVPSAGIIAAATATAPVTGTLTFAAPHGLTRGQGFTVTGATPAGYNGAWVVDTVPDTTHVTFVAPTSAAALTVMGSVVPSSFGVATTPARFFEFTKEGPIVPKVARLQSAGLRAGTRAPRADRFALYHQGSGGNLELEVHSKGFAFWFKHLVGTVTSVGPTDTAYTHTGVVGPLYGKSFTTQIGRPLTPSQQVEPFTFVGCKITSWELANAVDGLLILTVTLDAQDELVTVPLAAAVYPAGDEVLSFGGGSISVGGAVWDGCTKFDVKCDLGLAADRRFLRGSPLPKEPVESAMRNVTFDVEGDFDGLGTAYNRVMSATQGAAVAQIVATWKGVNLIGATTYPSFTVTIPAARFDTIAAGVDGPKLLDEKVTGIGMTPATGGSPLQLDYVTSDVTP